MAEEKGGEPAKPMEDVRKSFVCVVPVKEISLGEDAHLHRAQKTLELERDLESIQFGPYGRQVCLLPGGALCVPNVDFDGPSISVEGSLMGVFVGKLQNYAYLVRQHFLDETAFAGQPQVALQKIRYSQPLEPAELMCKLYQKFGTRMVSKLRGHYAFCVYNSEQVRVLAASDHAGHYTLREGRLPDLSLVIVCGTQAAIEGFDVLQDIPPGHFKYGWHAPPRTFMASNKKPSNRGANNAPEPSAAAAVEKREGLAPIAEDAPDDAAADGDAADKPRRKRTRRRRRRKGSATGEEGAEGAEEGDDAHSPDEVTPHGSPVKRTPQPSPAKPPPAKTALPKGVNDATMADASAENKPAVANADRSNGVFHTPLRADAAEWVPSGVAAVAAAEEETTQPSIDAGAEALLQRTASTMSTQSTTHLVRAHSMTELEIAADHSAAASSFLPGTALDAHETGLGRRPSLLSPSPAPGAAVNDVDSSLSEDLDETHSEDHEDHESELEEGGSESSAPAELPAPAPHTKELFQAKSQTNLAALDTAATMLQDVDEALLDALLGQDRDPLSKQMLCNMLYDCPCAISVASATAPDLPLVYVNSVFERCTGYKKEEVIGRNCRFLQAPPGQERVPSVASTSLRRALAQGRGKTIRILNYQKSGTPMWTDLSIVPMHNVHGEVTHFLAMSSFHVVGDANGNADGDLSDTALPGDTLKSMRSQSCLALSDMA